MIFVPKVEKKKKKSSCLCDNQSCKMSNLGSISSHALCHVEKGEQQWRRKNPLHRDKQRFIMEKVQTTGLIPEAILFFWWGDHMCLVTPAYKTELSTEEVMKYFLKNKI